MKIMAIDAGTTETGYVVIDEDMNILDKGIERNCFIFDRILNTQPDRVVIEMIESYGMPVGVNTFKTVLFIGALIDYCSRIKIKDKNPYLVLGARISKPVLIGRKAVKMTLCNSMKAKDSNIRQAIIDLYPAIGGGKTPQIGTAKEQGKLYGIKSHMWSALALGIAYIKGAKQYYYEDTL